MATYRIETCFSPLRTHAEFGGSFSDSTPGPVDVPGCWNGSMVRWSHFVRDEGMHRQIPRSSTSCTKPCRRKGSSFPALPISPHVPPDLHGLEPLKPTQTEMVIGWGMGWGVMLQYPPSSGWLHTVEGPAGSARAGAGVFEASPAPAS